MLHSFKVKTSKRTEFIDITSRIASLVNQSETASGLCIVFIPHTTAGLTINENADPDVRHDILTHLEELVPLRSSFRHAEGNSDAHIKATFCGFSHSIIIHQSRLLLGIWQAIYFAEFDGPRERQVHVKIIGE